MTRDSYTFTPPIFSRTVAPPPFAIIDVHLHVGTASVDGASFGALGPEQALMWMAEARVGLACASPPMKDRYTEANRTLRDWASTTNERVLPVARLRGARGPRPVRQIWQARAALRSSLLRHGEEPAHLDGMAGVELAPHLDGMPSDSVFEAIAERRLPTFVRTGATVPPSFVAEVLLPRLPGPVVLTHLGCYPGDEHLLREAVALAVATPRVWLDTSAAAMAGFVRYAVDQLPDRILFGSDAPLMHPATAWAHVASALPDAGLRRAVGQENAARLLGLSTARPPAS